MSLKLLHKVCTTVLNKEIKYEISHMSKNCLGDKVGKLQRNKTQPLKSKRLLENEFKI